MAVSFLFKHNFIIFSLVSLANLCCYTGYAQNAPGQMVANALLCFNDKIYTHCDDAYRLTPSGNINVPPEATDLFCNGPCLAETQLVLNCIDSILSNFLFYNQATATDVRRTLSSGCSFTSQRGNFNVESYIEGYTSRANQLHTLIGFSASAALITILWCM